MESDRVRLHDGAAVDLRNVRSFCVAYANRQFLYKAGPKQDLPPGVAGLKIHPLRQPRFVTAAELARGRRYAAVTFGRCRLPIEFSAQHYLTALTNVGTSPIRVLSFGGYSPARGTTGGRWWATSEFTDAEFRAWYGVAGEGWIAPGAIASDLSNWSRGQVLWVYRAETREGAAFVTGELWDGGG